MKKLNPREWTRFWDETASITTFGTHSDKNYELQILEFWRDQLIGEFAHVVDLACGNGALSWIAHKNFAEKNQPTKVTGVDIADIKPFETLGRKQNEYPQLQFVGNTNIDELPFADRSIDMAISQYGFEYSDVEKAVLELDRVLKPVARISLVMHSTGSELIKPTVGLINLSRKVLDEVRLDELYLQLDQVLNSEGSEKDAALLFQEKRLRAEIGLATMEVAKLCEEVDGQTHAVANYVLALARAFGDKVARRSAERRSVIEGVGITLRKYLGRIEDMRGAALSRSRLHDLGGLLEDIGFSVELDVLEYQKVGNVGATIVAKRE